MTLEQAVRYISLSTYPRCGCSHARYAGQCCSVVRDWMVTLSEARQSVNDYIILNLPTGFVFPTMYNGRASDIHRPLGLSSAVWAIVDATGSRVLMPLAKVTREDLAEYTRATS